MDLVNEMKSKLTHSVESGLSKQERKEELTRQLDELTSSLMDES